MGEATRVASAAELRFHELRAELAELSNLDVPLNVKVLNHEFGVYLLGITDELISATYRDFPAAVLVAQSALTLLRLPAPPPSQDPALTSLGY